MKCAYADFLQFDAKIGKKCFAGGDVLPAIELNIHAGRKPGKIMAGNVIAGDALAVGSQRIEFRQPVAHAPVKPHGFIQIRHMADHHGMTRVQTGAWRAQQGQLFHCLPELANAAEAQARQRRRGHGGMSLGQDFQSEGSPQILPEC